MDLEYTDTYLKLTDFVKIIDPEMCENFYTFDFIKLDWVYTLLDSFNDFLSKKSNDFSKTPRLKKVVSRLKKMCDSYTDQLDSIDEQNDNFEYLDEDDIEEMGLEEDFDSNEEDFSELRAEIFKKLIQIRDKYGFELKLLKLQMLENREREPQYIPNDIIKEGEFFSKNLFFLAFLFLNERDNEPLTFHNQSIIFNILDFNVLVFPLLTEITKHSNTSDFDRGIIAFEDYIFKILQFFKKNELITSYSFFIKGDLMYLDIKFNSQHIYDEINKNKISRDTCIQNILKSVRKNKKKLLNDYLIILKERIKRIKKLQV